MLNKNSENVKKSDVWLITKNDILIYDSEIKYNIILKIYNEQ